MSKEKKFVNLSLAESRRKMEELGHALVKFKVSGDASHLGEGKGEVSLRREMRLLARKIAVDSPKAGDEK